MSIQKSRVFVVDDHPLVREWLSNHVNQQPDLAVCGEADDPESAIAGIETNHPDVAIIDLSLKKGSGLDLIKTLRQSFPRLRVLVLSMHDESTYAERALRAGAHGYLTKGESTQKIIPALREVLQGKYYMSQKLTETMAARFVRGRPPVSDKRIDLLSDRELEVFGLMGSGVETRGIAETLHVSVKTVQAYYARIKEKLNLATGREMLREAIRWQESLTPQNQKTSEPHAKTDS
jgi:DNA-binding NarL/FixJ family response regulator